MTENSTQTDLNSKWMLLTLVTGKPKGMADFGRGLIHQLRQYCSGTALSVSLLYLPWCWPHPWPPRGSPWQLHTLPALEME